ncbi:methionine--tRNA ligase [Thaumasiovibrio subtropicus]|uniref:methionine--tRNA ligase n=1 Tax=Thaumasiovibrio subtropicus TaxID=1891207 RepID=UPI000B352342|nr:methionine--tRNA ligase [Thaumasiovibrio subtropicus]
MTAFITTPIFYANGAPHLGHAYSGILADILHRYALVRGQDCRLITGTDEHGQKIAKAAAVANEEVQSFVDGKSAVFQSLWPSLGIDVSQFIRTTEPQHQAHVKRVWEKLAAQGDIQLGSYGGLYCVGCEQYYVERDLVDGNCPVHLTPAQQVEEETYLFDLEKYRARLLTYYQQNPGVITPHHFQASIMSQLEKPLEPLSISRFQHCWGVEVPDNQTHTIYVWIDALFSYLTAIEKEGNTAEALENTTHVIGKDILQFHAVYWPIFLLALGLPLPKRLLVHGWWTINGHKISKSIPETTVHPSSFAQALSEDGLRYALVRQKPAHRDGNLSLDELSEVINADLANNFANLVKRNNTLILKYFSGRLPAYSRAALDESTKVLFDSANSTLRAVEEAYQNGDVYQVTLFLRRLTDDLNNYFHHRAPWLIHKTLSADHVAQTCAVIAHFVQLLARCYYPITPRLAIRVLKEFGVSLEGEISMPSHIEPVEIGTADSHFERIFASKHAEIS